MSTIPSNLMPTVQARPSATLGRAGATATAILCLSLVALLVVMVRVFVFQHFHGNQRVLDGLLQALGRGLGL